jgi:histidinol-phosphatase (PHP family)
MLYDTHLHTEFSHDSRMRISEVIEKAREINFGVVVTEHIDLNYPDPLAFNLDVEGYLQTYEKYRSDRLLLGIEVGMGICEVVENRELIEKYPFDYILGSIHVIGNMDIYDEVFYTGRTKMDVYNHYFDAMAECVQGYNYIDSLGHIDYIARYAKFEDKEIYYEDFTDRIDRILTIIAKNEKCLEINTRRLGNEIVIQNLIPIYKRFYDLGGRWVTIGSDAHHPGDIGKHFSTALQMADYCNLKPVWFKERQLQYVNTNV